MAVYSYGALARAGKVKYQTPKVQPTTDNKYNGGVKKLRKESKENVKFKSGAKRMTNNNDNISHSNNTTVNASIAFVSEEHSIENSSTCLGCGNNTVSASAVAAPSYQINSMHKFNTVEGIDRVEYVWLNKEMYELREKSRNYYDRAPPRNHKKWHRNHPSQGIYQRREIDLFECDIAERDEVEQ